MTSTAPSGLPREGRRDGRQILELVLHGVVRRVTRRSTAATIDRVDREPGCQPRSEDPERGVVGCGSVHQDQRRPHPRRDTAIGVPSVEGTTRARLVE